MTMSIPNHKSWGAEIFRESPSTIICHLSCVTCKVRCVTIFFQSGGASHLRVCYQRGLPRLVFCAVDCARETVVLCADCEDNRDTGSTLQPFFCEREELSNMERKK